MQASTPWRSLSICQFPSFDQPSVSVKGRAPHDYMAADQADDLDKAILISFAQDGRVEESLKVKFSVMACTAECAKSPAVLPR